MLTTLPGHYVYIYIFFSFPGYLLFSGIQENEPGFIDLSDLKKKGGEERFMRQAFLRVGFADDSAGNYKLRPCPLGTFVDSSRTNATCKNCSAGKLDVFFFSLWTKCNQLSSIMYLLQ